MSEFLTSLIVEQISEDGNGVWRLVAPLRYRSAILGGVMQVDAGFITDFASVPRLPVVWLLAGGCADRAAVVHDLCYQCNNVDRKQADSVFLEAMEALNINWYRRWAMWLAVRLFGWKFKTNKITLKVEVL